MEDIYKATKNDRRGTIRISSKGDRKGHILEDFGAYPPDAREMKLQDAVMNWHLQEDWTLDGKMIEITN